jgi:hypothetical protein
MKTTIRNESIIGRSVHNFGAKDAKGREIGAMVMLKECEFVEVPDASFCYYTREPGKYFAWSGQSCRDGVSFGASQPWRYCANEAERAKAIIEYLSNAKKRRAK